MRTKPWSLQRCRRSSTTCSSLTPILQKRWVPSTRLLMSNVEWFPSPSTVSRLSLFAALPELPEQHESPGHLPLSPQPPALFWPPHLVRYRGEEQRRGRLRSESPLRCSQPGKPALSLWSLVSWKSGGAWWVLIRGGSTFLSSFSQQADLALQEAIRIAQESNDHVCLQHCLVKRYVFVCFIRFQSYEPGGLWIKSECFLSELALHTGTDEGHRQHRANGGLGENGRSFLPAREFTVTLSEEWDFGLWFQSFLSGRMSLESSTQTNNSRICSSSEWVPHLCKNSRQKHFTPVQIFFTFYFSNYIFFISIYNVCFFLIISKNRSLK